MSDYFPGLQRPNNTETVQRQPGPNSDWIQEPWYMDHVEIHQTPAISGPSAVHQHLLDYDYNGRTLRFSSMTHDLWRWHRQSFFTLGHPAQQSETQLVPVSAWWQTPLQLCVIVSSHHQGCGVFRDLFKNHLQSTWLYPSDLTWKA